MTQFKPIPFTEIEKPPKKTCVIVAFEISKKDESTCQHADTIFNKAGGKVGQLVCDFDPMDELYECSCCGMMTCDTHMSTRTIHDMYVCKICEKLPAGIIEEIQALRLEINQ